MAKKWQETLPTDLVFDEAKHRYTYKGEYVPGVTTVLGAQIPKPALMFWTVKVMAEYLHENFQLERPYSLDEFSALVESGKKAHSIKKVEAATIGTKAHAWIEAHIRAALHSEPYPDMPEDAQVLNAVNAFMTWESSNQVVYIASEKKVFSRDWMVAGIADVLATVNGRNTLIDLKTSNTIYDEHYMQTAAYAAMLEQMESFWSDNICIMRIGKDDGQFEAHEFSGELRKKFEERFGVCVKGYFLDKEIKELKK